MALMPTRLCPRCQSNRHVTAFVPGNAWCQECRNRPMTPTEVLAELTRAQALTNPDLAAKQERLIQKLRAESGSDQEVLDKLRELFNLPT